MVVVVVVIVFNYTSPKFHKPVFSDYRQLPAFKENYEYIYFSISCSPASISDTFLHNQTKTSSIEMVTLNIKGSEVLALLRRSMNSALLSVGGYFPWVKATIPRAIDT
jgi:hypothetical protein